MTSYGFHKAESLSILKSSSHVPDPAEVQQIADALAEAGVSAADVTTDHLREAAKAGAFSIADMPAGEEITRRVTDALNADE